MPSRDVGNADGLTIHRLGHALTLVWSQTLFILGTCALPPGI